MTEQDKRAEYLINYLLSERGEAPAKTGGADSFRLLRALMNIREPRPISEEFLRIQDEYLKEETERKGITDLSDLEPVRDGIYLWRGDITTLRCDGIVNAANSRMLGCFSPCHGCIDNAIHTFAGVQLRLACAEIMRRQGQEEEIGKAKITPAYNLPCGYVLHTVGPIIRGGLTDSDRALLASCYRSCLETAEENRLHSLAFCCISTGEFHFPNDEAAKIAIETTADYKRRTNSDIEVIFNVFKELDYEIYRRLLRAD